MKRKILFIGLLIISIYGFGQTDFTTIDKKSRLTPDSLTKYLDIAAYLTTDLLTDKEKVRAIYIWISHNIRYDLNQINSNHRYNSSKEIIKEVLKNRQGVCQHYSELFRAMSESIGVKTHLISGYTRDVNGRIADLNHAWNAVEIDSNYYLIDVTWAAGYELNNRYVHKFRDNYFLTQAKDFIKDHMPFDPIWQFSNNPINNEEFISKDFSKLNKKGKFIYRDSIAKYENLDKLNQLQSSNKRIIASGVKNKLIQKQIAENIRHIINAKYNLAIDTLNYGIDNYNLYITHKNRRFHNPKLSDSRIKELIDNAGIGIYQADKIFYGLFSDDKELNNMIIDAKNRMPRLISDLKREKDFVNKYLKKWKPLRIFIF